MAVNIESLCEAGANIIVDDIGYVLEAAFQDDIVAKGVNAAVADGCDFFSAGGNDGNLTYGTTGVWEGDYAAGTSLIVDGETLGVRHVFGGGVEANEVSGFRVSAIVLQWADPLGASANDYDLFLVNEDGDVIASSTDTQDGTQDPVESILSPFFDFSGLSLVVVKTSGSDRYLRVHAHGGTFGDTDRRQPVRPLSGGERGQCGDGRRAHRRRVRPRLQWDRVRPDEQFGRSSQDLLPTGRDCDNSRQFFLDWREVTAEAGSHRSDLRVDGDTRLLYVLRHLSGGAARGGDWGLDARGGRWSGSGHPGAAPYRDDVRDRGSGHRDDRRRS